MGSIPTFGNKELGQIHEEQGKAGTPLVLHNGSPMSSEEKDLIDDFHKLASSAWQRYTTRRDVDWKVAFGLWTLFGAGAVAILTAKGWPLHNYCPNLVVFIIGLVVAVGIVISHTLIWVRHQWKTSRRDMKVSYLWETEVLRLHGRQLPEDLKPPWASEIRGAEFFSSVLRDAASSCAGIFGHKHIGGFCDVKTVA